MPEVDRSLCVPVMPGGSCPNCGWSPERPFIRGQVETPEPHAVLPHGAPKLNIKAKCPNCGATYNLDTVKCGVCRFEPASGEMFDKLKAEKNVLRRTQGLPPLPVRAEPITNTSEVV